MAPREGGVSLAHLFGGLLLTDATASKALGEVLRGTVTLDELRRGYIDYLEAGEGISYRRFLEPTPTPAEPPQRDTPAAAQFVQVPGRNPEGGGLLLGSGVVTATWVTGVKGDGTPITVRFAPDADWLPAEVIAQTASLTLLRPSAPQSPAAQASLSTPELGMEVTYEGMDGPEVEATIAEVGPDRITLTSTLPRPSRRPIFEAATGAVVGIAESPSLILSAAVLSRPPFGRAGALGTLGGAGNDSVAETDQLNFHSYVDAFSSLICIAAHDPAADDRIFGSWGMGKSFLLEHIQREIDRRQRRTPKHPKVHVVRFNAWEYTPTDVVWPALVRTIVAKLDQDVPWPRYRRPWTRLLAGTSRARCGSERSRSRPAVVARLSVCHGGHDGYDTWRRHRWGCRALGVSRPGEGRERSGRPVGDDALHLRATTATRSAQ